MDQNRPVSLESQKIDREIVKLIEWEEYQQELARLVSLSCALNERKEKKLSLHQKLEPLIKAENELLSQSNELYLMQKKLEARKKVMGKLSINCKISVEDAKKREEELSTEVRSLLVAGTALSVNRKRLQESNELLYGEKGCAHLKNLQKTLRKRQQYMISQVSFLYPVKIAAGPTREQELDSFPSSRTGNLVGSKPSNQSSLTILGLHLTGLPFKKMSFFTNKKEVQKSATALGYVAHAVSLVASYLKVPLRYSLLLGGSCSRVIDHAPSAELISSSADSSSNRALLTNVKHVEFPLYLDGQDTTRAAYAVFLLNKDVEQLLNFIGVESLGPRHVLANLKELVRTIQSADYLDS